MRVRNEDWQVKGVSRETRAANKAARDREDYEEIRWERLMNETPPPDPEVELSDTCPNCGHHSDHLYAEGHFSQCPARR